MDNSKLREVLEKVALGQIKSQDAAAELGLKNSRFHQLKRAYGVKRPEGVAKMAKRRTEEKRIEREHVCDLVAKGDITFRQGFEQLGLSEFTFRKWIARAKANLAAQKDASENSGR